MAQSLTFENLVGSQNLQVVATVDHVNHINKFLGLQDTSRTIQNFQGV